MANTPRLGNCYAEFGFYSHVYPFDMPQPDRIWDSTTYRYGYNGMETDPEVKEGAGQHYTTYFRQYDPRLGRWWSNDPITHPGESPYAAMYNNPIYFSDASGASGEGPPDGSSEEYVPPQEVGCPECEANVPDPEIGQLYITSTGWGYNYYGAWLLHPGDEVTVTADAPEALPGEHRFSAGNLIMDARAAARLSEDPLTMPGEYFHKGQWIPAAEYRAKVQNVVNNIDNPAYDPAQDGFYFGEGSKLQAPFTRLFTAIGERTHGTSNEMLPSGSPNPFAHTGLETPAFAPEAILAGFAAGWWAGGARGGAGGGLARGSAGEFDDVFVGAGAGVGDDVGLNSAHSNAHGFSIRNVNPTGGTQNCVNCAIATDATLSGSPTVAMPGSVTSISVLEQTYGAKFTLMSQDGIVATMEGAGSGVRGIVFGSRGPNEVGHVFNVANQGGVIRFLDGQTGAAASLGGYNSLYLLIIK